VPGRSLTPECHGSISGYADGLAGTAKILDYRIAGLRKLGATRTPDR
jgi:hypothetical protein